jgi:hypothetical protein
MERLMENGDNLQVSLLSTKIAINSIEKFIIKLQSIPILKVAFSPPCFQAIVEP